MRIVHGISMISQVNIVFTHDEYNDDVCMLTCFDLLHVLHVYLYTMFRILSMPNSELRGEGRYVR
jgi:hypothetical protein